MRWLAALLVLVWCGLAAADDAARPPPTTLVGRVTDVLGKPIAKARLYVLVAGGRVQAETDADGRYTLVVPGGASSVIIAVGKIHTYRQVLATEGQTTTLDIEVEIDASVGETIRIVDREPPAPEVPPKPQFSQRKSLPYSDEAKARDAWARAWLLLDVDEAGKVSRLKLLKRPGFGLDQIAIDEGFALTFEPALDGRGRPMRTYILWTLEWPSWGWLVTGSGIASGRPNDFDLIRPKKVQERGFAAHGVQENLSNTGIDRGPGDGVSEAEGERFANRQGGYVGRNWARPAVFPTNPSLGTVPCAGSGPLNLDKQNRAYRDCSLPPDAAIADALPWITRENARTALAELARTSPKQLPRVRGSRVPELTSTVVTGGLVVVLAISWQRFTHWSHLSVTEARALTTPEDRRGYIHERLRTWNKRALAVGGATVISAAVTAFLWSRGQTIENFSVQPTSGGGAVSWGRAF